MTRPGRLADQEARDAIRNDLDETLFVEAAAGTGKTTALVDRIVEVLRRGPDTLEDIVAVTFTEKAAGEMKLRLRAKIEEARLTEESAEARDHLSLALGQLELAHIGTIHGFCVDLLRERPVEAGVDPAFRVAAEEEAGRLLDVAFERWFEGALSDPGPGVRRALRRRYPRNSGGPRAALRAAAGSLVEQRDFDAPWSMPEWDRKADLDRALDLLRELAAFAPLSTRPDDYLTRNLRHIERGVREIDLRERTRGRDHDYLEAWLRPFIRARWRGWFWRGFRSRDFGGGLAKADVVARRDEVRAEIETIVQTADADLAAHLRDELWPVTEAFERAKRREGCLDFVDLLIRVRDLLRDNPGIRAYYRRRFTRFFVDEFQDTDPLQVEILLLLCSEDADETRPDRLVPASGKLFVVGDPKQSIYRFRRADVMVYEATRKRLQGANARVLHLSTSFRSQPRLQAAVNGAFASRMKASEDGSQAEYVPLEPFREDVESQPAVVALPVPKPYAPFGRIRGTAIEASLPDAVGDMVRWLVRESGWVVTEPERPERPVPIQARHICLLFRRFQQWGEDVTRPYVRALEARAIPHVLVGGRSYHEREEVLAVRNALTAIEWPDDRLAVYAALRGPLFSLGDRALFEFGVDVGPLHPLAAREPDGGAGRTGRPREGATLKPELRDVAAVLQLLGNLHRQRNRRPIPETIQRLLAAARAHAGIAIWPTGEQALANVLRLVDRARAFERRGSPSFRGFLDRLEDEAEHGQAEEAPIVEEGTEGVRMMTVHKAKGLEFPAVILADMTCRAAPEMPSRHMDGSRRLWAQRLCGATPRDIIDNVQLEARRETAEADRLAYVAATRARDLLIVPALGDGRDGAGGFPEDEAEWWLESLNPAVYPPPRARRRPSSAESLGAPPFGDDSVLDRPDGDGGQRARPGDAVAPGLHVAEAGTDVVWWDPAALDLDADPRAGDRQRRLLAVDSEAQPTLDVEAGRGAHREWAESRARKLEAGGRRSISATTAGAVARRAAEAADGSPPATEVAWIEVARPEEEGPDGAGRPGGARLGDLVHRVLAELPLDADAAAAGELAEALARTLGSPEDEVRTATALATRALGHEVFDRARAALSSGAEAVRREIPVFHVEDGAQPPDGQGPEGPTIVEGVADLAFRELTDSGPRWTVVDYKTDRRPAEARAEYEVQVACYVEAVRRATGEPARGIVLAL